MNRCLSVISQKYLAVYLQPRSTCCFVDISIGNCANILKLDAKGVNLSRVKHPTAYNKLFGSGGAAEGTRAVLAYQLAVFKLIDYSKNEILYVKNTFSITYNPEYLSSHTCKALTKEIILGKREISWTSLMK